MGRRERGTTDLSGGGEQEEEEEEPRWGDEGLPRG